MENTRPAETAEKSPTNMPQEPAKPLFIEKYADFYKANRYERILFFQGGKRSGKTHFICQLIAMLARMLPKTKVFAIAPDYPRMVDLRLSFEKATGVTVTGSSLGFVASVGSSRIYFRAFDRPEKAEQGKECDFAYFYECRSIHIGVVRGIMAGCRRQAFADFNPCEVFWKDEYFPDAPTLVTTYRDNPYLTEEQKADYVAAEQRAASPTATDYDRWWADTFCFGRLNQRARLCFENSELCREKEFTECAATTFLALDFGGEQGGSDPTALIAIKKVGQYIYIKELYYSSKAGDMTLADKVGEAVRMYQPACLVYETATNGKRRIGEIMRMGGTPCATFPAIKGAGSVEGGINELQPFRLLITETSLNLWNERNNYRYVLKDGTLVPLDRDNHCFDALRYWWRYYNIRGKHFESSE